MLYQTTSTKKKFHLLGTQIVYYIYIYTYNRIIDFICTDAWAPICIFLHVSGQNESVHIKSIDTLHVLIRQSPEKNYPLDE